MRKRSDWMNSVLALAVMFSAGTAVAQDYPTRPITVISPYAAGGPSDIAIRSISDHLSQSLGQPVIIENVAGAGGVAGTARAARAAADGYTLLINQNGLVISALLNPGVSIDVLKELTAIGMVNVSYSFLVGRTDIPADNVAELVAWMTGPGKPVKFAHPGIGSVAHLQAVLFSKAIGADATLISYRGGGQAMNDIVGGHADMVWAAPATAGPLIEAGKIKAFGFGAPRRHPPQPNIPTFGEAGYPQLEIQFWQALLAPAGTPKPVIDRLNRALREALADPKVKALYAQNGVDAFPEDQRSPEAANAIIKDEFARWKGVIASEKLANGGN
jgi:tripartite-type tricarboxylate transporter receptor subunit TctC